MCICHLPRWPSSGGHNEIKGCCRPWLVEAGTRGCSWLFLQGRVVTAPVCGPSFTPALLATVDMTVSKAETRRWPWSYPWEPGRHPRVCISQNPQQPRPASETDSPWDREPSSGQRAAAGARPPCVSSFSPARVPGSFLVILADVTCEFARREVLPAPECMCACVRAPPRAGNQRHDSALTDTPRGNGQMTWAQANLLADPKEPA